MPESELLLGWLELLMVRLLAMDGRDEIQGCHSDTSTPLVKSKSLLLLGCLA